MPPFASKSLSFLADRLSRAASFRISAGVSLGANSGSPVMPDYETPFVFTGTVKKALVDVTGESIEDKAAQMKIYLARQ